jgi:hypothetical protein
MAIKIIRGENVLDAQREQRARLAPFARRLGPGCLPSRLKTLSYPWVAAAEDYFTPIPRSQWKTLIEQQTSPFLDQLRGEDLPPHDQGNTNYCWAHGTVRTVEIESLYQTGIAQLYSAESIGVPVTGGRNRGGTPEEALSRLRSHGACRQELWPRNELSTRLWTPEVETDALRHRILRFLRVDSWDMQITLAFLRFPVAIGLRWWGHLVAQLSPVILPDGEIGIGCDNSWGADYGENGYFALTEDTGTADLGAVAPLSVTWQTHVTAQPLLAQYCRNLEQLA